MTEDEYHCMCWSPVFARFPHSFLMGVFSLSRDASGLCNCVKSVVSLHSPVTRYAVFTNSGHCLPSNSPCFLLIVSYQQATVRLCMFWNGKSTSKDSETVVAGLLVSASKNRAVSRYRFVGWWFQMPVGTGDQKTYFLSPSLLDSFIIINRKRVQTIPGLFLLRGCWPFHPFLGRPTFLLAVGCIHTLT
jgi:hypothetical protein